MPGDYDVGEDDTKKAEILLATRQLRELPSIKRHAAGYTINDRGRE